jgi:hydrogenase/urease accessory protein HupE
VIPLVAAVADAHRSGLSYASVDGTTLSLTFAEPELAARFPLEADPSLQLVADATIGRATVTAGGAPCAIGTPTVQKVVGDGIEVSASLSCPPGDWTFTAAYLADFEPGHREYLAVDGNPVAVLDAAHDAATFSGAPSLGAVGARFVGLGVEHIWTGYDHLAFLLALLLAAQNLRQMLKVVTGFTVAHSITLTLAATGLVALSPAVVEPAIAASIVFVGVENLWKPPPERRIAITFLLGLIHGFGFAGQLSELGLPRGALALALVSFNGGVEVGQACVVLVVLPLLLKLRAQPWWEEKGVPIGSVIIALFGLFWLVQRLIGSLASIG